jgi:hypothetical protein
LTYPLVLEITNHEGLLDPSAQDVRFKVTFDPKDLPEGEVKITDAGESWTVTLQVPAAARRIFLHSEGDLLLETQVIDLEQGKEFHKRGIESLVGHRWRNACVRHVSGWSFEAMEASLEAHKHSVEPTAYGPLAWWALGTDPSAATPPREQPWREVPILGNDDQEASIFGADGLLPDATGLVDNLHPVTGAWLLNVLAELGKISIVEQFTPFAGSGECDPLEAVHWGWATSKADPLVLGDSVTAMALTRGFPNGTAGTPSGCAALTAKDANGRTLPVGTLPYADGVAATDLAMPVWGTWTLELEGGTGDGGPLPKSVEVAKPALKGSHDPESKKGVVTWPIEFSDHQPSSLQGWVLFKHWTCDRDAEPEGDGTVSSFALDVEATPAGCKDPYCKLSLAESGQFVTGASTEDDPIPDADCVNKFKHYKKALADGQAFKVSVDLARIVQKIRADFGARQKKAKRKGYVNLRNLAADGMSIEVHCYYDNHTAKDFANLKAAGAAHAAHCEDVGDDGVKITVDPPGGAGVSRISFSPAKALQRLLEATPPGEGQVLRVAYGFVAPNGGRAAALGGALSDTFDPTRGEASDDADEVVEVDMQAVRSTCGDDGLIEVWSLPLVALSELKFTGEVVKEVKSTSITLKASFSEGATSGDFASARPRFVWTDAAGKQREFGKPVTGTTTLSGTLNLESLAKLSGKHVTIQATLTADTIIFAGQEASVPPLDIELPTRPHFENLEIKFDDDADVPCVEIVAESCCCGTNRALGLKVYKNDEETPLETSCRFKKPYATYRGFTDSRGKVVATITRKVFDRQFAPGDCAKFEFYRPYSDGKVYGHSMEATSVEETVPEESDEQTTGGGQ